MTRRPPPVRVPRRALHGAGTASWLWFLVQGQITVPAPVPILAQAQDALKRVRHILLEEAPDRNDAVWFLFLRDMFFLFLFPAAVSPGAGAALASPPLAVPSAPVVQAVAVSAGGVSYAGVMGGGA